MAGNRNRPIFGRCAKSGNTRLALLVGVAASFLLAGCAGTPPPKSQPAAARPAQPEERSDAAQKLSADLDSVQAEKNALQARLDNADNRIAELEKTNEALTAENRSLTDVLGRVAFDRGVPEQQLLREGSSATAITAGRTAATVPGAASPHPSLAAGSVVKDNFDPATGVHTLVDLRANAATGNTLFVSLSLKDGEAPAASLTVQRRYPDGDPLFLVRSVTVVADDRAMPMPLDKFSIVRYRSGPFRIEALTTSDLSVIVPLVSAILGDTGAGAFAASRVTIRESGVDQEYSRQLTPDELRALSNMVYVYRELGGQVPK